MIQLNSCNYGSLDNNTHNPLSGNCRADSGADASVVDEADQAGLSAHDFRPPLMDSSVKYLDPAVKIDFVHGSNSACLEQVIREGLLPFCSMNRVPFSGALDDGILENGVNQKFISAVEEGFADRAFSYAVDGLKGWNPFFSIEESKLYNQEIDTAKQKLKKQLDKMASGEDVVDIQYVNDVLQKRIDLQQVRLNTESQRRLIWDTLNENQRELIRHPFPVLLGITYQGETQSVRSQVTGEHGLPSVSPQNLIIFVPENEVERTKEIVIQAGSHIPVRSLLQLGENLRHTLPQLVEDIERIGLRHRLEAQERLLVSDLTSERLAGIEFAKERCIHLGHTLSIEQLLTDPELEVVFAAITALSEIGQSGAFAVLKKFNPQNDTVKVAVSKALFNMRCRLANE